MTFPDLSPCTYFGDFGDRILAVGWLERGFDYLRDDPYDGRFFARLLELLVNPWQPVALGGFHTCTLCRSFPVPPGVEYESHRGGRNLFVPAGERLFAAPELITHYLVCHGYGPPREFQDAVLACPPMRSMDYLRAVRRAAPPAFLRRA